MGATVDHLALCRHINRLESNVNDTGMELELRTDFGFFVRLCESLDGKPYPTAMVNPLHHHIGPENGFWIKGTNDRGEIVHVQAVRFDEMTGTNLANEFKTLRSFYADPGVSAEYEESCDSYAPAARRITGRVCYHGEMWLKGGGHGFRGRGLTAELSRIALGLALLKWRPQFVYGFGYDTLIKNGVMSNYGYWHMQPGAVHWERPSRENPLDVWLVWLTENDLVEFVTDSLETEYRYQPESAIDTPAHRTRQTEQPVEAAVDTEPTTDLRLAQG